MGRVVHLVSLFFVCISFIFYVGVWCGLWLIVKANSNSLENGYYFFWLATPLKIKYNDYVAICIADKKYINWAVKHGLPVNVGFCKKSQTAPLIKRVKGIEGDTVLINKQGVFINGKYVLNSKPIQMLTITTMNKEIMPNEFIVMGTNQRSFDSRYFGVINKSHILGKGFLLWKI